MATRAKSDISLQTVLIVGGAIVLWPVIKGLLSAVGLFGDILQVPGDIINALKDAEVTDKFLFESIHARIRSLAKNTVYDPHNESHRSLMAILTDPRVPFLDRTQLIQEWKNPKQGVNLFLQGVILAALQADFKKLMR